MHMMKDFLFIETLNFLRMREVDFTRLKKQLKELFPEVDDDYLYFPFTKDEIDGTTSGPKGFIYDHYKRLCKHLKEAG